MIQGRVSELTAEIAISFTLPEGRRAAIAFVIDTGFLGGIALPEETLVALGFPLFGKTNAILADGTIRATPVYDTRIVWGESTKRVAALAMGDRPLLGTALLEECRLEVEFTEGGAVRISPLGNRGTE